MNPDGPESFCLGSNKKVWWKCAHGHVWSATIANRTKNGSGCPYCSGKRKSKETVQFNQLKKFATGKGTGQKSIVVREVFKRWGIDCKDDNQADACVLAHLAEGLCMDKGHLLAFQQEVADKIEKERPHYNCGAKKEE